MEIKREREAQIGTKTRPCKTWRAWTQEEIATAAAMQKRFGNNYTKYEAFLPDRSYNQIKCYFTNKRRHEEAGRF